MPSVSIWLIRSSLVALLFGATAGAVMLVAKGVSQPGWVMLLLPAHVELVTIGWLLQLAMGTALWILPRFGARGPARGDRLAWLAFGALNGGVLCGVATAVTGGGVAHGLQLAGRMAELVAITAFIPSVWSRVRASGISAM